MCIRMDTKLYNKIKSKLIPVVLLVSRGSVDCLTSGDYPARLPYIPQKDRYTYLHNVQYIIEREPVTSRPSLLYKSRFFYTYLRGMNP